MFGSLILPVVTERRRFSAITMPRLNASDRCRRDYALVKPELKPIRFFGTDILTIAKKKKPGLLRASLIK